ncbi:MAG: NAD(P)H-dependent glycerol-3-phosphate dehydrogenase [Lentisphaeria bacterium]|nr:NAD(P)H-dependent glycerol-3-phosphate dehydrogenase [Lentisphaeria bacterium]
MKTSVISDGAWGTALALTLIDNGHDVIMWGLFPDYIRTMRETRENSRFLPGVPLPPALQFTAELTDAVRDVDLVILATPAQYLRGTMEKLAAVSFNPETILCNVAKGIEVDTLKRPDEIVFEFLPAPRYACLCGPSHAEEVARRVPTAVVAASACDDVARAVQQAFTNDTFFRVYTSPDVIGVELGGALKNIFAVAAGICDGMRLGDNSKAALMTRGIVEMGRLGEALGGCQETFSGLSGVGDLIVTCMSQHSRNRHVGEELGKGRALADIQKEMNMVVAEGVKTTLSAYSLARRAGVNTPIIDEIHAVLYGGKDPRQAVRDLMTRDPKPEGLG